MPPRRNRNKKSNAAAAAAQEAQVAAAANADRQSKANDAKNRGNEAFAEEDYVTAIGAFTQAITLDRNNHVYYSNRSAAYLATGQTAEAVADAMHCVDLKPDWIKGYTRVANALKAQGDKDRTVEWCEKGLAVDANNTQLKDIIASFATSSEPMDDATRELKRLEIEEKVKSARAEQERIASGVSDCIGIDLGTTYSCVAVWKENNVEIIANSEGSRTTPSYVSFNGEERLIGQAAKSQAVTNPSNTVFDAKRIIGRNFRDEVVKKDAAHFPFKLIAGEHDKPMIEVEYKGETKQFAAEEISAMVLTRMKETAEEFMGTTVDKAVVTVPAYFNDSQRQATKDAGRIAGLEVKRIINEPTAAALAYGLDSKSQSTEAQNVLIFDLGGGTFDVSILTINGGIFEVKATGGDTHLGGEDFDNSMVDFMVKDFNRKNKGMDISSSSRALRRLRSACENAKRLLSTATSASVELESLFEGVDYNNTITRAKFEQLNKEYFERTLSTVTAVMKDAAMEGKDIDDIVLVGGSTRIPKVQQMLMDLFDGRELCKSINPDEAVAFGAAVQGAILSGIRNDATSSLLLVDVTPLSLGIETSGRVMSTLIKRNTAIPVRKTKVYTTEEDWQQSVDVCVYEGERACVDANNKLGEFRISGLERAKRGVPQVEVTFEIDANGLMTVSARDQKTGAKAATTISSNSGRLSQSDIDRMVEDAEKNAADDAAFAARAEARNELEALLYGALDAVRNNGNQPEAEANLLAVRDWLDNNQQPSLPELSQQRRQVEKYFRYN